MFPAQIFNPDLIDSYSHLDTVQIVQLMILVVLVGLIFILWRFVGNQKSQNDDFNKMTGSLLSTMQTQATQNNERENKLAQAIDRQAESSQMQAGESNKIAKALMLIHREQKRQGVVSAEQHEALMKRVDALGQQVTQELSNLKTELYSKPGQLHEVLRRLDILTGYMESLRLKNRTSETNKLSTGESFKVSEAARSDGENGYKLEASESKQ